MTKYLSEFKKIAGLTGVFTAEKGNLRCSVLRLATGGLCVFSPVLGLGEKASACLSEWGDVEFLLAPNYYHNKGLKEYLEAFPEASICSSPKAKTRLEKITNLEFQDLSALQAVLPNNMHLVFPKGLKTGEVWIKVVDARQTAWLVVDAFSGPKGKLGNVASEPEILATFPKFGVNIRTRYWGWVERQIKMDNPTMIVPCHGNIVCSPALAESLQLLIRRKL